MFKLPKPEDAKILLITTSVLVVVFVINYSVLVAVVKASQKVKSYVGRPNSLEIQGSYGKTKLNHVRVVDYDSMTRQGTGSSKLKVINNIKSIFKV